ncbi:MAG: thioredoxin family protein [Planctomycetota bacterium]
MRSPLLVALALVTLPDLGQAQEDEHKIPPVFRSLSFDAAKTEAKNDERLFLVDAMTSWCGPCKEMDRTTWIDPTLVEWLEQNTVPIQLDMDLNTAIKEELGVKAFPTIVVMKGDRILDRVVGLRDAEFVLEWLQGLRSGRTHADRLRAQLRSHFADEVELTYTEMVDLAQGLAGVGAFEDSLRMCQWLFENARNQRIPSGPIGLAVANLTSDLSQTTPDATKIARDMRDAFTTIVNERPNRADLLAWMRLSRALGESDLVVEWSKAQAKTDEGRKALQMGGPLWFGFLIDAGAFEAAGHNVIEPVGPFFSLVRAIKLENGEPDPVEEVGNGVRHSMAPTLPMIRRRGPGEPERTLAEQYDFQFRDDAGQVYAALLAASRSEDATKLADYVLENCNDKKAASLALVTWALKAEVFDAARDRHLRWLRASWL